ncbi:MAG: dihydrolipoyl dehydrogenase [Candidatus Sericytochromatia bacterium]|nr:MAG: dihydrolipoyl dehydrogenase [Candidatus Sericytochromatia bacterium]
MELKKIDNVIVGAGPGGYVCAIKMAQLGKKVLLIEKEKLGGVCLNVGCIPSKALINASKIVDKFKFASELGFSINYDEKIDMLKLQSWKNKMVNKLTSGIATLLKANKVEVIYGNAYFKDRNHLELTDNNLNKTLIEFENLVIATGSSPIEIPNFKFDEDKILSSTGGLNLSEVPEHIVIIGGGYIGMEIGTFLLKLGSKITIIEATSNILPTSDQELVSIVLRKLKRNKKANILTNTKAKDCIIKNNGVEITIINDKGIEEKVNADKVLVAVGRKPNTKDIGIENLGIELEKGFIKVNKKMQTNISNIYAIGDVVGGYMLAHKASKEGIIAAEVIAGGYKSEFDNYAMPSVIFTDPEIASVGLTEDEAIQKGYKIKVGRFPFAALGKSMAIGETEGFVKIIINEENNLVLGLHIVGYDASSLISEGALAIEMGATAEDMALTIHPHPTLPEAIMEAAEASFGKAIHIVN